MSAPPSTAVAQRLATATPAGRRAVPESDAAAGTSDAAGTTAGPSASVAGPSASIAGAAPARHLPILPVSRSLAASSARSAAARDAARALDDGDHAGHAHVQRVAGPSVVPTLGARPLRPGVAVTRDADALAPAPPVAARWSPAGDLPATIAEMPAASADDDPVPLQRFAAGGPPDQAPATSSFPATREIVFPGPGGQGLSGGAAPSADVFPAGGSLRSLAGIAGAPSVQRAATAGASPAYAGGATSRPGLARPSMALVRPAPGGFAAVATQGMQAPAPPMQRIVSEPPAAGASATPSVQASRAPAGLPAITATPVVQRVDGAAPEPPAEEAGTSDEELDDLARKLFGRIRTHLRSEVIHEREAKGLSFDAF
jgi:hypothetical protein